jgi:hypothetical protein
MFRSVEHEFPERGHSFLDSDRDFGRIETAVKCHQNIYIVDENQSIMLNATRTSKPVVTRMADEMFEIEELAKSLQLVNQSGNINGEKIPMRDQVKWMKVDQHSLTKDKNWKEVSLLQKGSQTISIAPSITLLPRVVPIKKAKYDDLRKQLIYIPDNYRGMYQQLTCSVQNTVQQQEENSGVS